MNYNSVCKGNWIQEGCHSGNKDPQEMANPFINVNVRSLKSLHCVHKLCYGCTVGKLGQKWYHFFSPQKSAMVSTDYVQLKSINWNGNIQFCTNSHIFTQFNQT